MDIFAELKKPFAEDQIHWRVGAKTKDNTKGMVLAYINARDVMKRLDDVVGPENWQCRYPSPGCCEIGIRLHHDHLDTWEWIWKANGAGETEYEGEKGQYSDAFKRAAVMFGIGRYLYYLETQWMPLKDGATKYASIIGTPALPKWAKP